MTEAIASYRLVLTDPEGHQYSGAVSYAPGVPHHEHISEIEQTAFTLMWLALQRQGLLPDASDLLPEET